MSKRMWRLQRPNGSVIRIITQKIDYVDLGEPVTVWRASSRVARMNINVGARTEDNAIAKVIASLR